MGVQCFYDLVQFTDLCSQGYSAFNFALIAFVTMCDNGRTGNVIFWIINWTSFVIFRANNVL